MDVWICGQTFFQIATAPAGVVLLHFSSILTKLGMHVLCANTEKSVERVFKILL